VIKPMPRVPVRGGLIIDDFTVDEQAGTVICPARQVARLSRTRIATFGATCRQCLLRSLCATSKAGRKLVVLDTRCDQIYGETRHDAQNPCRALRLVTLSQAKHGPATLTIPVKLGPPTPTISS